MDETSERLPIVFIVGPPGSGKTTVGRLACEQLDLRFLDLASPAPGDEALARCEAELEQAIASGSAEVITLPWELQDTARLKRARKAGELILLWDHPLKMMERSGRPELSFKPIRKQKSGGGFGSGTNCYEFRRLDRACGDVIFVGNIEQTGEALAEVIGAIRDEVDLSPAEREGIIEWAEYWQNDISADPDAAEVLVDAMARYTLHLKAKGTSPRTMKGVYSDLNAAGFLVFSYDEVSKDDVLDSFSGYVPYEYEFRRKFSDRESAMKRYRRSVEGFGAFLVREGLVEE